MHKGRAYELKRLHRTPDRKQAIEQEAQDIWTEIVKDYSNTQLSFVTDKMIAIKGLVTVFEDITGWRNIYCLWRPFLVNQLLWSPRNRQAEPVRSTGVAPSWSWACSTGRVEYQDYTAIGFPGRNRVFVASFEEATKPQFANGNPNYNTDFVLTLRSYIFQAQVVHTDQQDKFGEGNERVDVFRNHIQYEAGTLQPDRIHMPNLLFFVPLCVDQEPVVTYVLGLCVEKENTIENAFKRCGMICFVFWGPSQPDLTRFSSGTGRDRIQLV